MKIKPLSILPNIHGYEFTGIKHDGSPIACCIKRTDDGQYVALAHNAQERVYGELSGWVTEIRNIQQ